MTKLLMTHLLLCVSTTGSRKKQILLVTMIKKNAEMKEKECQIKCIREELKNNPAREVEKNHVKRGAHIDQTLRVDDCSQATLLNVLRLCV